jgi:hypothetical protein
MNTNKQPFLRWGLLAGHLGTILFMVSCSVFGGVQQSDDGLFQLDDGNLEVQDENGDWVPVGGTSFELVGELESTDPWTVAGAELETRDSTLIEEGLEVGGLVRVRGVILEDETWVAYSIESAEEVTEPIMVLIGVVDSIDPWVVNGIELNVTDETDIQGDITPGMIARVEILLLPDGTQEVISIAPLGESTDTSGCVTVIATVVSMDGNEIQFLGWPAPVTIVEDEQIEENENGAVNENENDGVPAEDDNANEAVEETVSPNQVVMAVVCISDDGQLIIVQVTLLNGDDNDGISGGEKVLICHRPSKPPHTLSIASAAVPAHLAHGDTLGPCP